MSATFDAPTAGERGNAKSREPARTIVDLDYSADPSMMVVETPVQRRSTRDASGRAQAVIEVAIRNYLQGNTRR